MRGGDNDGLDGMGPKVHPYYTVEPLRWSVGSVWSPTAVTTNDNSFSGSCFVSEPSNSPRFFVPLTFFAKVSNLSLDEVVGIGDKRVFKRLVCTL